MSAKRPNIVFILDRRPRLARLACYGSTFYETPNIDRLARRGCASPDAYAACPVCSPTRASLLTGKYPARPASPTGSPRGLTHPSKGRLIDAPYRDHLAAEEITIAHALQDGGYAHVARGQVAPGRPRLLPRQLRFRRERRRERRGQPGTATSARGALPRPGRTAERGKYLTDRLTDEAIELIRGHTDRPFFLNFWHYAVHMPRCRRRTDAGAQVRGEGARMGLDKTEPFVTGEPFPTEHKSDLR